MLKDYLVKLLALSLFSVFAVKVQAANDTLRVCAAQDELPYSNSNKEGFENRIAEVVAEAMGRQLEYVWSDRAAIFIVNDYLSKGECDVVMGLDADDPRVLTSKPYYRSGYVFIYRADKGVNIDSWDSPDLKKLDKFAFVPGSAAEPMIRKIGKYEQNFNYLMALIDFKSRRNSYSRYHPDKLVSEVASGNADIAVLWGPEVARYVNASTTPLTMKVVKNETAMDEMGETVAQYYSQSLGVREGEGALLAELDKALTASKAKIMRILKDEGVPIIGAGN